MIRAIAIISILLLVVFAFVAFGQQEEKKKAEKDPAAELAKSIERGKKLFDDKSLGTNEMSCNSCHMEGGTKDGKMGDMAVAAFDNLASKYPRYIEGAEKVMTLSQVNNWCIIAAMKGEALKWDDQKLADLTAYVASVKKVKKMKEEAKEKKPEEAEHSEHMEGHEHTHQ